MTDAPDRSQRETSMLFSAFRPVVIAHRAANSLDALRHAECIGVDIVEADIWLHRNALEVRHSKTAGPLPVLWDRWSLERRRGGGLELEHLLDAMHPTTRLMLDVKGVNPRLPASIIAAVQHAQPARRILVCSQNWSMLERFGDAPETEVVHSIGNRRQLALAWSRLRRGGYDAISIHARMLDAVLVARLKEHVAKVITWPINSDALLTAVLNAGVDGITSDNTELIERIIRARDRQPDASPTP